ncbi:transporter substrate-binding domain-containing protein [Verticiella sediminum]|uniref:Transporter substrate-binding domain-containing protein n=1 Tax=Verticiella sediminum TaxID=1247510 RepID=A0A556AWV4_9BURK|nr:transporter substrate-binding domain-containing protein [Verticiella sediminum]TSH97396.1 transporter substrate-binding domain-containing protein [Verticiella sediminum]
MKVTRRFVLAVLAACQLAWLAPAHAQDALRVATDATFPPMEYVENGKLTGFDVELVEALAADMGKKVEWTQIDFKGLVPGLVSKRYDMAVSAIYITDERRKVVDFGDSYYAGGLVVMVKDGDTSIQGPQDLAGKNVTVQVGTKSVSYLKEHFPDVRLVEVEKNDQMFNLVAIGRADAAVTGLPAAYQYVRTRGGLKVLPEPLTTEAYGMAVRKDTPELTAALNQSLANLKANGTYDAIVKKWFSN